jgi:peroxiredoxin (alkyl hydroperoxide reductase subunit C)
MLIINETLPENLVFDSYLPETDEFKKLDLNKLRGKWTILIFYPADFTFICPTELGDFASLYEEFKKQGAELIGISTDTAFVHKAWHDSSPIIKTIKFPMLADPTGRLCKILGTYIDEEGLSLRGTFLIDPDGKLKAYELHDNSIGRAASEMLRKLQAGKFVREHGGEVCPANWKPGSKTLKPGIDLVGKI